MYIQTEDAGIRLRVWDIKLVKQCGMIRRKHRVKRKWKDKPRSVEPELMLLSETSKLQPLAL